MPPPGPIASSPANSTSSAIGGCGSIARTGPAAAMFVPRRSTGISIRSTAPDAAVVLGRRALPRSGQRRSQDHLGAQSPSALAVARPRVLADRRSTLPRSLRLRAGELARRQPAADRRQLGQHAGAGVQVDLLDLGAEFLRPGPARPAATSAPTTRRRGQSICCSPRSSADAHRAEPLALLQPEHAPARRRRSRCTSRDVRCRSWRAARDGRPSAAGSSSSKSIGRSSATADTPNVRRTTTATRSTSICWRSPSHESPATRRRCRSSARPTCSPPPPGSWPTTADACAHIGDDDGGALMPIAGRAADDWRDSLAAAAALLGRPELRVGPSPEEAVLAPGRAHARRGPRHVA